MNPEKRFFPTNSTTTTEAAIDNGLTRDLYIVLGAKQTSNSWVIRTYLKPFINWIWIGAAVLAIGGLLSLFDKRLRLGFVANKKANLSYIKEVTHNIARIVKHKPQIIFRSTLPIGTCNKVIIPIFKNTISVYICSISY